MFIYSTYQLEMKESHYGFDQLMVFTLPLHLAHFPFAPQLASQRVMLFPTWGPAAMFLPLFHKVISQRVQISSTTSQGTVLKYCFPKEGVERIILLSRDMGFALTEQGKPPQMLQALNIHCLSPLTTYYFAHDKQAYASAFYLPVTKHMCKNDDLQIGLPLRASNLHSLLALLVLKRKKRLQAKSSTIPLLLGEHCCTKNTKKMALL